MINDQDAQAVVAALELACLRSGLTASALARALGTSPSRFSTYCSGKVVPSAAFFLRATRVAAALGAAHDDDLPTSHAAGLAVAGAVRVGHHEAAIGHASFAHDQLDDLLRQRPARAAAWDAAPATGSVEWDTLLAAVATRVFERHHLPAPWWCRRPPLSEDWFPSVPPRSTAAQIAADTPDWLAARRIFISEEQFNR